MTIKLYDLARVSVASAPGTGTISLGSAIPGFLTFALAGVQNGEQVSYAINDGTQSETGAGTYTSSGTTLSRDTVYASTNGGSKINASAAAQVFITVLSESPSFTGILTETTNPAANTSTDGVVLQSTTAASNNNQQFSPRARFSGQGWSTGSTLSQTVDWIIENEPVQGSTATANLVFANQINGGGYTVKAGIQTGTGGQIWAGSSAVVWYDASESGTPMNVFIGNGNVGDVNVVRYNGPGAAGAAFIGDVSNATVYSSTAHGALTSSNTMVGLIGGGDDGVSFRTQAVNLLGQVDLGTVSSGIIPGRWVFLTATTAGVLTEALRINSAQHLLVNLSSDITLGGNVTPRIAMASSGVTCAFGQVRTNGGGGGGAIVLLFSTQGTITSPSATTNGTGLGQFIFGGDNGIDLSHQSAVIQAQADAAFSSGSVPGRIIVSTTPVNGVTPLETMRIDSLQNIINKGGRSDQSYSYQAPSSTGFSITLNASNYTTIIDSSATVASATITLSSGPIDGTINKVTTSQAITTLTVSPSSGQSVKGNPTTLAAGGRLEAIYRAANTTWYL